MENYKLWEEIIQHLNGTCQSLDEALNTFEASDLLDYLPFLNYLDNEIFLCHECGWWCSISEEVSEDYGKQELTCSDCCDN